MNDTGVIVGRLEAEMMRRIIVKHPDEDIRQFFMRLLDSYPEHPDEHGFFSLIVSQPIQVME